jgi:hypothetical protein
MRRPASTARKIPCRTHVVVKDRLAARKQQRHLFAPVRSGVLGKEGPTFLNVELAWFGSVPGVALRLPTIYFIKILRGR